MRYGLPHVEIIDCDSSELDDKLIVKDNKLVNACYNLSLVEMRIINLAVAKKGKTDAKNKFLSVSAEDYAEVFKVHRNTAYEAIDSAKKTLFDKQFSYFFYEADGSITNFTSRWVQAVGSNENQQKIMLCLNQNVLDMISNTNASFTAYRLKQTTGLSSAYSLKLYEIIMSYSAMKKIPTIELLELKFRLGIEETEYPKIQDFKKRVLHPAINEINDKTNLFIEYTGKTKGRKIIGINFSCTIKSQKEDRDPNTVDWVDEPPQQVITEKEKQKALGLLNNLRNDLNVKTQKREKITINQIVSRHPNETIGKSEPEIYKMFGNIYHII